MSSKILLLIEGCGTDIHMDVVLRRAVAQALTSLASKELDEAAELIVFCSETLRGNPQLLQTEEVEDIVRRLCFPMTAAWGIGGKEEDLQGNAICQKVCEFLAGTMSSSFRKHHLKPCEMVMKACAESLVNYRYQIQNRDQGCSGLEAEEEEHVKCDLSISSATAVLSTFTKELRKSSGRTEKSSSDWNLWWCDLTGIILDILEIGEARVCVQLAQIIVPKDDDSPVGGRTRSGMLEMIWGRLVSMHERGSVFPEGVNENIYLTLCVLSDAYFPSRTSEETTAVAVDATGSTCSGDLNLLQLELFWKLIQRGLTHSNPLTRKRCTYLMKRAIDVAATSGRVVGQGSQELATQPLFTWDPAQKEKLLHLWLEFFLIYETLDEVQIHVVTPVMPKLAHLTKATYKSESGGKPVMHSSWLCVLYQRCFVHESKTVTRLGVAQCLNLDLDKSSFLDQSGIQFILGPLMTALHEEYLYTRQPDMAAGSQPLIGLALKNFMVSCVSQLTDDVKTGFLSDLLILICEQSWGPVTFTFVAEALASIPAFPAWGHSSIFMLRDMLSSGFMTCPTSFRSTILCFFLRAALHLIDWSTVSLHQLSSVIAVCNAAEVLKRGSPLWEEVCQSLRSNLPKSISSSNPEGQSQLPWQMCIQEVQTYLHVDPTKEALENDDLPNAEEAQRVAVTMLAVADSQDLDQLQNRFNALEPLFLEVGARFSPVFSSHVSALLQPLRDTLGRAGSHVYLPKQKVDKALQVLQALLRESQTSCDNHRYSEFCTTLTTLLCETLDEIFEYLIRQLLGNQNVQVHDVSCVTLYRSFLDAVLDHGRRAAGHQDKSSHVQSLTLKIREGRKQFLRGCEALLKAEHRKEHYVEEMHRNYVITSILSWILSSDAWSCIDMLPSTSNMLTSLLRVEGSVSARLKEVSDSNDKRGLDGSNRGRLQSDVIRTKWEAILAIVRRCDALGDNSTGRLNHEYDSVAWQPVLSACLLDISLVPTEDAIPLLKCTALLIDKVADENIPLCVEAMTASWCVLLDGWKKLRSVYEAFITVTYQPALLKHGEGTVVYDAIEKYTAKIFSQGETKLGMVNTLMSHLDNMLSEEFFLRPLEEHRYNAMSVIRNLSGILHEAALYGPIISKSVRLIEDISAYLERHEELLTVRQLIQDNSYAIDPRHPRVHVISILMKIGDSNLEGKEEFFEEFFIKLLEKDEQITPAKRSYIINSVIHRIKLRVWQTANVILNFLSQDAAPRILARVLSSVRAENQTSTRHLIEVFVVRTIQLHPHLLQQFWQYAAEVANSKDISFSPYLMIIAHLGVVQPKNQQESFYLHAIPAVLPWTFVPSMALRVQAQVALCKMWKDCKEAELQTVIDRFPGVAVCMDFTQNNSALGSLRGRMEGNFFLNTFHPIQHFSIETIFYDMPHLTLVSEDELVPAEVFLLSDMSPWRQNHQHLTMPLRSWTDTLRTCTARERQKNKSVKDAEIQEEHWSEDGSGDIQKKITPWRESHIPGFEPSEGQRSPRGHLVVVASLVDRIPNLGGLCRTCEIFGASCLVLGNLAYKDHQDFLSLSVSAERWLPIREVKPLDLKDYMMEMKQHGYTLVGVEQTANSQSLTDFKFPKRTMLLLGKEREGIPVELIQLLDVCVEIPQLGFIRSLNVHVSGALMVWEYTRQKLLGL